MCKPSGVRKPNGACLKGAWGLFKPPSVAFVKPNGGFQAELVRARRMVLVYRRRWLVLS